MQRIHFFRAGTHTASNGNTLSFSDSDIQAIAANYNPDLHEAPLVIGHPEENGPAYGWVKGVSFSDNHGLDAEPDQVNADFDEMVAAGAFKKISASLYTPSHPGNPTPGSYYLRHIGFFGATPPAIKGLNPVEFNDGDGGELVEFPLDFGAYEDRSEAGLFRRMREWMIARFGVQEADDTLPDYAIQDLERAADQALDAEASDKPQFSESKTDEVITMTQDKIKEEDARLKERQDELDKREADFAERQKALEEKEAAARRERFESQVDALVDAGKVLPMHRDFLVNLMENQPEGVVLSFGESDAKEEKSLRDGLSSFLESLPVQVDFKERSSSDKGDALDTEDANALAAAALSYREEQRKAGRNITISTAMTELVNKS